MKKVFLMAPLLFALGACSSVRPLDKKGVDIFSNQNLASVQKAFEQGYSSESTDDSGRTALMYAVWKNPDPKAVDFVISKSLKINAENETGNTALMIELQKEDARFAVVDKLLRRNADVKHRNKSDISPILTSARRVKDPKIISALIRAGANVNDTSEEAPVSNRTPLLIAAETNPNPDIVLTLIKEGARKDVLNENRENALMIAVSKNKNQSVIKALLPLFNLNERNASCESVLQKVLKRPDARQTGLYTELVNEIKKKPVLVGKKALCNTRESYGNRINSWSGAPFKALETEWGKAFKSRRINENIKEYFYGYAHQAASETGSSLARRVHGDSFADAFLTEPAKPRYKNYCQTSFMIENGIVISAQYIGNACGGN